MLQMYGEKAEEAEELKLDIEDLKTMYRQQVMVVSVRQSAILKRKPVLIKGVLCSRKK